MTPAQFDALKRWVRAEIDARERTVFEDDRAAAEAEARRLLGAERSPLALKLVPGGDA